MRLQVKTLTQKSLIVEIDETKTVFDLKQELSLFADVGVRPELQKLIYAGKILENADTLSAYNFDASKFIVVMVLKQPAAATTTPTAAAATTQSEASTAAAAAAATTTTTSTTTEATAASAEVKTPAASATPTAAAVAAAISANTPARSEQDEMVANIVGMGYPEVEVRRALAASFNNPERAIEYLIEGIPDFADDVAVDTEASDLSAQPFEMMRDDPVFRQLRRTVQQHPDTLNEVVAQIAQNNPALLNVISEHQQEFLNMLMSNEDSEEEDETGQQ